MTRGYPAQFIMDKGNQTIERMRIPILPIRDQTRHLARFVRGAICFTILVIQCPSRFPHPYRERESSLEQFPSLG